MVVGATFCFIFILYVLRFKECRRSAQLAIAEERDPTIAKLHNSGL